MLTSVRLAIALSFASLIACGDSSGDSTGTGASDATTGHGGASSTGGANGVGGGGATSTTTTTATGGAGQGGGSSAPTASELLAKVASCNVVSTSAYKTDSDSNAATIDVCGLSGAVFWKADMDVDCDGQGSNECNLDTDPAFYPETSATDSNGDPLDAATLPFVVVPLPSARFDYAAAGIKIGAVVAVIYDGQVEYGVFGDEGPKAIIGEASYAMASSLGIDPDPSFGGVDSGVTYIVFTGSNAVVAPIEDHAAAVSLGQSLATALLAN